ncbi:dioxygenase [Streptacidiphilus pinicola]|uniref:Dioxygenase n=1 Tax=Streptacidiphilus pinicola TaxID=2219663 RepID=A0A2X0IDZ1_9ACTN|nr:carotenoid oxygenase family protein [Streptacidiphilus pinicola]RAG81843.1 dioxygenase [Streptacidiphilus pinicola]
MTAPLYLTGHLAPVTHETEGRDLPVEGALPPELNGRYFRNGPNPRPGEDPGHWFTGDGMLHGVRLQGGRALWYRNRWVRTAALAGAAFLGPEGPDLRAVTANTNVVRHAGRILALVENGLPYQVDDRLETLGAYDFGGRLTTAMTAHPKEDPVTGELHFFGYSALPPFLTYHRAAADGTLVESREIPVGGPTMMHDFAITEHHVVWLDLPVVFDPARLGRGMPYRWDDGYAARIGVMAQHGASPVRWFEVEPGYVFHVGNAREDAAGRILLDAVRYGRDGFLYSWERIGGAGAAPSGAADQPRLHQWTLDPRTGRVVEQPLDDRSVEFPTINETLVGRSSRYRYAVAGDGLVKYDLRTGASSGYDAGPGQAPGEAVFVPAAGARAEDDGWLLTIVSDREGRGSAFTVLDASDLTLVATVPLPQRVPAGFHGNWLPDDRS